MSVLFVSFPVLLDVCLDLTIYLLGYVLLGTLRNVSSAGEPARVFMRSCAGLVDALLWTINSAVKRNDDIDNKVRTVCVWGVQNIHIGHTAKSL